MRRPHFKQYPLFQCSTLHVESSLFSIVPHLMKRILWGTSNVTPARKWWWACGRRVKPTWKGNWHTQAKDNGLSQAWWTARLCSRQAGTVTRTFHYAQLWWLLFVDMMVLWRIASSLVQASIKYTQSLSTTNDLKMPSQKPTQHATCCLKDWSWQHL